MLKYALLTLLSPAICWGLIHQLRFYTGPNQTGDEYVVDTKQPDLTPYAPIMESVQSYCSVGFWRLYKEPQYENYAGVVPTECVNLNPFEFARSVLFNGPNDTSVPALTILKGTYNDFDNNSLGGEEVVSFDDEIADFGFVGRYLLSTGRQAYNLYTEPNFGGASLCFGPNEPGQDYHWFTPGLNRPFRSARKGC